VWEFNSDNQLVVSAAGKKFNFTEVPANVPRYETQDAVLLVKPNKDQAFSFELRGDWALSESHDLSITINGKTSVIDGFVNDPRSRFMFHFSNKKNLLQGSGTWICRRLVGICRCYRSAASEVCLQARWPGRWRVRLAKGSCSRQVDEPTDVRVRQGRKETSHPVGRHFDD
jgi:hypothetical protein